MQNHSNRPMSLRQMVALALFVAIGVVLSPLLRVEGYAPMQHFINVVVSVFMGPWYSLLCAVLIGLIRMMTMSIPPLALTGAIFGAFLSGFLYERVHHKFWAAWLGEVLGTGLIGSIASYPVMKFLLGRGEITFFFYTPSFTVASMMGAGIAVFFLIALQRNHLLDRMRFELNARR
ncbi:Substrate-specific component ThiW of predicted thiazole ECF transporter [Clostridiaceae bacterium JG1575]|nr:Substrate-specific component ThiW of predicted thiazole ECF transporter [Clostridiaceae bacterium JG1575]